MKKKGLLTSLITGAALIGFSATATAAELGEFCWDITDATTLAPITTLQLQTTTHGVNVYEFNGLDNAIVWTVNGTGVTTAFGVTVGWQQISDSLGSYTISADLDPITYSGAGLMTQAGIDTPVTVTNVACLAPLTTKAAVSAKR